MTRRRGHDSHTVYSVGPRGARSERDAGAAVPRRAPAGDGIVRVQRETKGRRGKTVTTVTGVPLPSDALRELAGELKRRCGTGGAVKDGVLEIQGDHVTVLMEALRERGYTVKRSGG